MVQEVLDVIEIFVWGVPGDHLERYTQAGL